MSNVGKAIAGKLTSASAVIALTSNRVYGGGILPQSLTLPAISYFQVNQPGIHASARDPNIQSVRIQVSSWSTSYTECQQVSRQVKKALQDYSGSTWLTVQRIFFDDETDLSSIDPDSKQATYQIAQDYIVWFST